MMLPAVRGPIPVLNAANNVATYWNIVVSNCSLIVAVTAISSALLCCSLNSGSVWTTTRALAGENDGCGQLFALKYSSIQ